MTRWGAAENVGKSGRSTRLERNHKVCPVCGKRWTADSNYMCNVCEAAKDRRETRLAGSGLPSNNCYILLSSPDDCWQVGGMWPSDRLRMTLADGHMTPGTLFRCQKRRYVVVGAEGEPQRLEAE